MCSSDLAKRARYTDVILPSENQNDIREIEPAYIEGLQLHFVDTLGRVLELALLPEKVENPLEINI